MHLRAPFDVRGRTVDLRAPAPMTVVRRAGAAAAETPWPFSFAVAEDYAGFGSSTMNGFDATTRSPLYVLANEDVTGATYYDNGGSTPASGPPPVIVNIGAGGSTSATIETAVSGASAREKGGNVIVQLGGNYASTTNPVPTIVTDAADIVTLLGHVNYLFAPKHADGATASGSWDWATLRRLTRELDVIYPGKVEDVALMFRNHSTGDSGDDAAQLLDQIPPSLDHDTAHPNLAGNRVIAEKSYGPWVASCEGVLPFVPNQRRLSLETTNQTDGGLVCVAKHDPDGTSLTGATVSIVGNSNFTAVIESGEIRIKRATGTYLSNGYYNLTLKVAKGGYSRNSIVQVFLGAAAPTGTYRAATAGQIMAREGTINGSSTVTKLTVALGIKPLAGWDADVSEKNFVYFGQGRADIRLKATANQNLGVIFRNAAGTQIFNVDTLTTALAQFDESNGIQWLFTSCDWDAGTYTQAVGATTVQSGATPVSSTSCEIGRTGSQMLHFIMGGGVGSAPAFSITRPCNNCELVALGMWNTAVDFTGTTWRDAIRDPTTKASVIGTTRGGDAPGQLNAVNPILWMEGPAGNFMSGLNLAAAPERWDCSDRAMVTTP